MTSRAAAVVALLIAFAVAPEASSDNDVGPSVADLAWLAGSWHGEAFGGTFEEMWSEPSGGTMVGTFKLLRDGLPEMYEIMLLAEVDGRIEMRVKHFGADLVAWEERGEWTAFPLVEAAEGVARFDGLVFERRSDGAIDVRLRMKSGDGAEREEHMVYHPG